MIIRSEASKRTNKKGFTLIEVIVALFILAVLVPASVALYNEVLVNSYVQESYVKIGNLGQQVLDHLSHRSFDTVDPIIETPFNSFCFGTNGGTPWPEGTDCGGADNPFYAAAGLYADFSFNVQVSCLAQGGGDPTNLDTWTSTPCGGGTNCCGAANYEVVTVAVTNTRTAIPVSFSTLRARE